MKIIKVKIDGEDIDLKLPENWDEITVGQFEEVSKILNTMDELNAREKTIELISFLCDIDQAIVWKFKNSAMNEAADCISFAIKSVPNDEIKDIKIGDETYKYNIDLNDLNNAEIKIMGDLKGSNPFEIFSSFVCILYKKVLPNGALKDFSMENMDRVDDFRNVIINDVYGAMKNFTSGKSLSTKAIQNSSQKKAKVSPRPKSQAKKTQGTK